MRIVLKPAGIVVILTVIGGLSLLVLDKALPRPRNTTAPPPNTTNQSTPPGKLEVKSINLTMEGKRDWCAWGSYQSGNSSGSLSPLRKVKATSTIGSLKVVGSAQPWSGGTFRGVFWNDGTPIAKVIRVATGLFVPGVGNGFSFTVPANHESRTLHVYVQGKNTEAKLTADLASGSKKPVIDMTEDIATDGSFSRVYAIHFTSPKSDDTLKISWIITKTILENESNICIQAASLQ